MTNAAPRSAVGIDIGGTGIKGAVVDLTTGALLTDRVKIPTPKGGEPKDIVVTVREVLEQLSPASDGLPLGVCFPAIVRNGRTMSAANVSDAWIGLEAEELFVQASRQAPQIVAAHISPKLDCCCHGKPRSLSMMNHADTRMGIWRVL